MHAMTDPRPHFERAADQLAALIDAVRPELLTEPTPCAEYDVRALLSHVVGGTHRISHVGEGGAALEVPAEAPGVSDDGWPKAYAEARARLVAAWADDARLTAAVSVPWGEVPGRVALAGYVMEAVAHAWDLARALGDTRPLDAELAEFTLEFVHAALPAERRGGPVPFDAALPALEGADAYGRLAAFLGRRPDWAPDPARAAAALAARVSGPVLRPGEDGYDAEVAGFQTAFRHRPAVVVGARTAEDVRAAVEFARAYGLPVGVQATGHGLPAAAEGGVLISTRRMTGVRVDPEARTAWFEAGVRWARVVPEAARHGLAPLSGSAPHVGAVGYTLGGGLGLLSREFGYAADHVRSLDVVTADGRLRHVTADSDPDLFWALRGGVGNFGVVTAMEVDLFPVARLYGGGLMFDAELAEEALRTYLSWTETVPEELTSSIGMIPFPDLPQVPEHLRGRYVAHIRIAYTGDPAEGERLVAPLRAVGPRLVDSLREMPYAESGSIYDDPEQPHPYQGDAAMLSGLDASAARTVVELTGPGSPVWSVVQIRHLGGALGRRPAVENAVAHRDARFLVSVLSMVGADDRDRIAEAHRALLDALAPGVVGRAVNFVYGHGERGTGERLEALYGAAGLRRLTEVKAAYDPGNIFRLTYNLPPAR
ncbi:TIGR03086 family metal-binding protein [Streptomyces sp. SAJ15]|uniref:TIGR03086 family metal-binding protein n=1 Tax=Streptomyces sp. SAJ15 TaxID=2011095 RepID=UPI00164360FD|nr:TIGR03086 family metal-binding protein [Streptomyces sp. SAJ15]